MILPFDPTLMLLAVVAVFIYCAFKGNGKKDRHIGRTKEERWSDELKRRERYVAETKDKSKGKTGGGNDYLMWLYNHRQE